MKPVKVPKDFNIIAHRGASGYAPENTLPAFTLAKKMGISDIELDTQISTDGIVVVCHDKTLERYNHGDNNIENFSSEVLLKLDMGKWFSSDYKETRMLTLEHLLTSFGSDFNYHIELKGESEKLPNAVYKLVKKANLLNCTIFTSFSYEQLVRMHQISSNCRLGWLVDVKSFNEKIISKSKDINLFQLCPRADLVTKLMVQEGKSIVSEIRSWGLQGSPSQVHALIHNTVNTGCDGMTINWPDWAVY